MNPQDIASNVTSNMGQGSINWSTTATFCTSGGQMGVADDQRSWD